MGVITAAGLRWLEVRSFEPWSSAPVVECPPCLEEIAQVCVEALSTVGVSDIFRELLQRLPSAFFAGCAVGVGISGLVATVVGTYVSVRRSSEQAPFKSSYRCPGSPSRN